MIQNKRIIFFFFLQNWIIYFSYSGKSKSKYLKKKKKEISAQCFCLYWRYKFNKNCTRCANRRGKKKTKTLIDQPGVQYMAKYIFFIFRKYQFVQSDHDECDRGRYTWSNTWCKFHRIFPTIWKIFSWKKYDTRAGRWWPNRRMSIFNEFNLNFRSTGYITYFYVFS